MQKPIFTAIILIVSFSFSYSQNSPDCRSAIPVCADSSIIGFADGSGDIDDFDPEIIRSIGCLQKGSVVSANIENNTVWYVFRAGTDGQVGFDVRAIPTAVGGVVTAEWDFAVFGPNVDCQDISSGAIDPIRCNYEVNNTNFTGIGVNPVDGRIGAPNVVGSQNTYDEYLEVQEGELYYILINNFNTNLNGDVEQFELTFTGNSVEEDQNTALDCTLRDQFLGLDITACEGDEPITLSALNSPIGNDIASVSWSVDYDDNGTIDEELTGTGPFGAEYIVESPNSGRYFATLTTISGSPVSVTHPGGILITFYATPELEEIRILEDLRVNPDGENYSIEVVMAANSNYAYAVNGGNFQESPIFTGLPPGVNTLIIEDTNGCGITEPLEFLIVGYPKFFSPNGDNQHDFWQVSGLETLTNASVFIFDRYGRFLAHLTPENPTWNGTFQGVPLPASDYWFELKYDLTSNLILPSVVRHHFSLIR